MASGTTVLRLGYMPLTDCLPLVVAKEQGFFAEQNLAVELSCEASWANIRDKVIVGHLDGAHMLAPTLLASSLGIGGVRKRMVTAFALGLNGNAVTVSNRLFSDLGALAVREARAAAASPPTSALDAVRALALVVRQRRDAGLEPLVFATVFPFSCHNYLLRYWLAAGGIDPDRDVKLVALPPAQMVDNLRLEHIDGYCVGEPWNSCAAAMGLGRCLATGFEIWQNAPDKVFGVTEQWHQENPERHAALLRALDAATAWIENNLGSALQLLDRGHYVDVPVAWLAQSLTGELRAGLDQTPRQPEHFHVFHDYCANFPWRSHAQWLLQQMARWGQLPAGTDIVATAEQVYRSDFYREIFGAGRSLPLVDDKIEGVHAQPWAAPGTYGDVMLGPDLRVEG